MYRKSESLAFIVFLFLYGIELIVLTFMFAWYYVLAAAVVFYSVFVSFDKNKYRGFFICILVSIFTFVTLLVSFTSVILAFVLAFLLPAASLVINKLTTTKEALPATCPNSEYLDNDYWCDLGSQRVRISSLAYSYQDISSDHAERICNGNYTRCPLYLSSRFSK